MRRKRKGAITKAGNAHARFYMVVPRSLATTRPGAKRTGPSAIHYKRAPKVSKELTRRQIGVAPEVVDMSWRAQTRLHKRFWTLVHKGLPSQKAQVAVARELAGYVWAVGQGDYLYEDVEDS